MLYGYFYVTAAVQSGGASVFALVVFFFQSVPCVFVCCGFGVSVRRRFRSLVVIVGRRGLLAVVVGRRRSSSYVGRRSGVVRCQVVLGEIAVLRVVPQ